MSVGGSPGPRVTNILIMTRSRQQTDSSPAAIGESKQLADNLKVIIGRLMHGSRNTPLHSYTVDSLHIGTLIVGPVM